MRVLGSTLYVYELAKNLMKQNCDVTVLSQIGGPLTDLAKKQGIKCLPFEQAPGFKLGDGKWGIQTENGLQTSQPNVMYRIGPVNFDIIHMQHKPVAERMIQFYPEIDKIYSIHSEVIELEDPIKHESIKKYIAIRPEIKDHIIDKFEIDESLIEVIYNPIDNDRFKPKSVKEENYVLFVGTIDYLRKETNIDLIDYTSDNGTARGTDGRTDVTLTWAPPRVSGQARGQAAVWSVIARTADGRAIFEGSAGAPRLTFSAQPGSLILKTETRDASGAVIDGETRQMTVPDYASPRLAVSTPVVLRARNAAEFRDLSALPDPVPFAGREFVRTDRLLIRFAIYGGSDPAVEPAVRLLSRRGRVLTALSAAPLDRESGVYLINTANE